MQLRADSINESQRSIDAVLATENPVTVYDWNSRQTVDEVLVMKGCEIPSRIHLLDNHQRWSNDDVFGSISDIRVEGSTLVCRLNFADMAGFEDDDQARRIERAWTKVKQRHLREVSVGYRVLDYVTIPTGESQVVAGRKYTAGNRPLRIATKWLPREGSLTPVAADAAATTRKEEDMDPLRRYLVGIGLRADATMTEIWSFVEGLTDGQQRGEVQKILDQSTNLTPPQSVRTAMESWETAAPTGQRNGGSAAADDGAQSQSSQSQSSQSAAQQDSQAPSNGQRSAAGQTVVGRTGDTADSAGQDVESMVRNQIATERSRVTDITRMFADNGVDNDALQQRAISEGWNTARVAQEILPMVRQRSSQPLDNTGHIGIHSRSDQSNMQALALAVMVRNGTDLDNPIFERSHVGARFNPNGDGRTPGSVLALDVNHEDRQRAMEEAHRIAARYSSLVDLCELGLRASGRPVPHNRDEMVRAALSSSAVQGMFTTDVNARLLGSYATAEDTTQGWCRSEDRDDFKANTGHTMGKFNGLTIHSSGKTADDMDTDSESYSYRLYRFSGKFTLDEMDIINDRFGGLEQMSPEDMGASAAEIRPNMVYALLLSNPTFNGTALFHTDRNNIFTGAADAFGLTSLTNARAQMAKQRIRERILNLRLRYVLAPWELEGTIDQLFNSIEVRDTTASKIYGTTNPTAGKGFRKVLDDRLSAAGVVDPVSGTKYTGTATNWYGTAVPGEAGAKTIVVGYRRGTGRMPQLRSYALSQGQWGVGWDINMDIGSGFEDYRGIQKHSGTA